MEITRERAHQLIDLIRHNGGGHDINLVFIKAVESLLQGVEPAAVAAWTTVTDSVVNEVRLLTDHVLIGIKAASSREMFDRADDLSEGDGLEAWAVPLRDVEGIDLLTLTSTDGGLRATYRVRVANERTFVLPPPEYLR